ncbi:hypothetical protein [Stutzerimonas stutzeri]|uniref:hypothetical protein n=1 Tax=Stutzerimonas stutzeri TaxID=316 RepID=UPI0021088903|nr:hypothetical protein [Stutzerimonas stutzeri]MCQ4318782.1 hypothetical protein [Stutzerimonas stutzeri]
MLILDGPKSIRQAVNTHATGRQAEARQEETRQQIEHPLQSLVAGQAARDQAVGEIDTSTKAQMAISASACGAKGCAGCMKDYLLQHLPAIDSCGVRLLD